MHAPGSGGDFQLDGWAIAGAMRHQRTAPPVVRMAFTPKHEGNQKAKWQVYPSQARARLGTLPRRAARIMGVEPRPFAIQQEGEQVHLDAQISLGTVNVPLQWVTQEIPSSRKDRRRADEESVA